MENEFFKPRFKQGDKKEIVDYFFRYNGFSNESLGSLFFFLDPNVKSFTFEKVTFNSEEEIRAVSKSGYKIQFRDCIFKSKFSQISEVEYTFLNKVEVVLGKILIDFCSNVRINVNLDKADIEIWMYDCKNCHIDYNNVYKNIHVLVEKCLDFSFFSLLMKDALKEIEFDIINTTVSSFTISRIYLKKLKITGTCSFKKIMFRNVASDSDLYLSIDDSNTESLDFLDCNFQYFKIVGDVLGLVEDVDRPTISTLGKLRILDTDNLHIEGFSIEKLTMSGSNYKNIIFSGLKFNKIKFFALSVEKNFKINGTFLDSIDSLEMGNTILDGLEMNPSFLHKVKKFEFKDSSLTGIRIFNFKEIPEQVIVNSSNMNFEQKIDFTRELTALMIQQNNRYLTTVYKALEQDFRLESNNFKSKADKVILTLNSLSNSHGTRPEKAFFLILVIILIHFLAMSLEFAIFSDRHTAWVFLWNNLSYYVKPFDFITDVHFKSYNFSKGFIVFDFLYKITFAYLLYQFIAAFRKFNK